jgi:hypothetical protein
MKTRTKQKAVKIARKQARQGDVFLMRVDRDTNGAVELPREGGAIVLAHGEVTGHAHKIREPGVAFLRQEGAAFDLIRVTEEGCTLKHELPGGGQADHDPIHLAPGTYERRIQSEWDYLGEMARQVAD